MWPRYGILLGVADGNWSPYGPKQNHRVLKEAKPLNAWPTGMWLCPGTYNPNPQVWENNTEPLLCGCFGKHKATGVNSNKKIENHGNDKG
jgi:hypothetical protein